MLMGRITQLPPAEVRPSSVTSFEFLKMLGTRLPQEKLFGLYKAADCYVSMARGEGFGLPVLEAMAAGVPIVTTSGSSLSEVAGECGYLCDPSDPTDIAGALERGIGDSENKVEGALERAKTFTWKRCGEHTLKAYEDAVKFRRGQ